MKIYEFATAPNCRRVRMYMVEKGIDADYVGVDITKGENLSPDFRSKDINKKVPVLELDDGTYIAESVAIQRYFEELHPEPPLFGRDAKEKAQVEMWNRRADFNLMFPVGMCFQHVSGFFKDRMNVYPDFGEDSGKRALKFMDTLNNHFSDHQYLVGDYFSVADISMVCSLDFGKVQNLRPSTENHPHLTRWREQLKERPSFKA
ncbi:glutathione S-transferase family protein [Microbulbifer sp. OS29]|uniref:Glutathione S-transferase family protein n=1 Tax=Microbulbifer okhotskensis TaxID=2926617 RepID=A0A9X2EMY2_9GAMM|nr:glutathione S-transferase family protein [Microbulbifer okhotskensis]MCO1334070.1 glutathione S-transferase family protein [Microbulbifer okhotskensis]